MEQNEKWLQWAVELQSLAQAGIHYTKDPYDEATRPPSWRRGRRSFRTAKSCWSRRTTASGPCPEAGVT